MNRGTDVVQKLLAMNRNIRFIIAGWFADEASRKLIEHPAVDFRGVMSQGDALKIAADEADYILCVYAPKNENNINASPNKIYDSIQTKTPVIINAEIRIASFVKEHAIGLVIDHYDIANVEELADQLFAHKNAYQFDKEITHMFVWENIEYILIQAHAR